MWRCKNVGGLGEHMTCIGFSGELFLMIHMSYGVFLHKDMPLRGAVVASHHLGEQIPPKKQNLGGMNRLFQA